jgi:hypothetical protein
MTLRRDPTVPDLPPGTVLSLSATDWRYGRGQDAGTDMILVVARVRTELSTCYGGEWAWIDGHASDCGGDHQPCRQALVRSTALPPPVVTRRTA